MVLLGDTLIHLAMDFYLYFKGIGIEGIFKDCLCFYNLLGKMKFFYSIKWLHNPLVHGVHQKVAHT